MKRAIALPAMLAALALPAGCGTACGPIRTVPVQRVSLVAASPAGYSIQVQPDMGPPIKTPVPPDGKVVLDVPVSRRASTILLFGLPVYHYPPPETLRVIRVLRGEQTVCKLSAQQIGLLPVDTAGYHLLRVEE